MTERFVVVTTDKRGVFAGVLDSSTADTATLINARMCVYWSADVRGVIGLAATGPTKSCRVTRAAPEAKLNGVTAILDCTEDARKAWESEPWR